MTYSLQLPDEFVHCGFLEVSYNYGNGRKGKKRPFFTRGGEGDFLRHGMRKSVYERSRKDEVKYSRRSSPSWGRRRRFPRSNRLYTEMAASFWEPPFLDGRIPSARSGDPEGKGALATSPFPSSPYRFLISALCLLPFDFLMILSNFSRLC